MIMEIQHIPRSENVQANALSHHAPSDCLKLPKGVFTNLLEAPSMEESPVIVQVEQEPYWMNPIISFLEKDNLLENKK